MCPLPILTGGRFKRVLVWATGQCEPSCFSIVAKPTPTRALDSNSQCTQLLLHILQRTKITFDGLQKWATGLATVLAQICPKNGMVDVPSAVKLLSSGNYRIIHAKDNFTFNALCI